MRYAVVSPEGTGLATWARLVDEGEEVMVYIKPMAMRRVGDGLIRKTPSLEMLLAWANEAPSVVVFESSGMGKVADQIRRRGGLVVHAGSFCDRLESDRVWSERLAALMGMTMPRSQEFPTISAARDFASSRPDEERWVFKSNRYLDASATYVSASREDMVRYLDYMQRRWGDNVSNILQEKIEGVALSTAAYWNGRTFVGPFEGTMEHKKFMDGDRGPATGCALNVVWMYEGWPRVADELCFPAIEQYFRREEAPPGIYDVNAVIGENDGKAYFLEWTPREGWDSEPTARKLLDGSLGKFYYDLAVGTLARTPFATDRVAFSVRLSVPPYPWEVEQELKVTPVGTPVYGIDGLWDRIFTAYGIGLADDPKRKGAFLPGEVVIKDPGGMVGLAATHGSNGLEALADQAYAFVKDELQIPNLQYRGDWKVLQDDLDALTKIGYETSPYLKG